jgi:hypothetical protein
MLSSASNRIDLIRMFVACGMQRSFNRLQVQLNTSSRRLGSIFDAKLQAVQHIQSSCFGPARPGSRYVIREAVLAKLVFEEDDKGG